MKEENGHWGNSKAASFSGNYSDLKFSISPDGKYLFFTSNKSIHESYSSIPLSYDEIQHKYKCPREWRL